MRRFLFDDRAISMDRARELLDASERHFAAHGWGIWRVEVAGETALVGFAGLLPGPTPAPLLVYGLRPEHRGRGYACESARAVLDHALGSLGLPRVVADVDEPNAASIRVLERLGMRRTGRRVVDDRPLLDFETPALG